MRTRVPVIALALLLSGCGSDDNYVISGYPPVIISPVRSALAAQMNFKDANNALHPQWVIVLTDAGDVCTKLATHADYFQNPIENFNAAIVWVPPGNIGTYFVGQDDGHGSVVGDEVLAGSTQGDAGMPQLLRLSQVVNVGANIGLTQFNVGSGQAKGSFDIGVFDPGGNVREFVGKFQTSYCTAMEKAQLP